MDTDIKTKSLTIAMKSCSKDYFWLIEKEYITPELETTLQELEVVYEIINPDYRQIAALQHRWSVKEYFSNTINDRPFFYLGGLSTHRWLENFEYANLFYRAEDFKLSKILNKKLTPYYIHKDNYCYMPYWLIFEYCNKVQEKLYIRSNKPETYIEDFILSPGDTHASLVRKGLHAPNRDSMFLVATRPKSSLETVFSNYCKMLVSYNKVITAVTCDGVDVTNNSVVKWAESMLSNHVLDDTLERHGRLLLLTLAHCPDNIMQYKIEQIQSVSITKIPTVMDIKTYIKAINSKLIEYISNGV
jgi:hypothetical protein